MDEPATDSEVSPCLFNNTHIFMMAQVQLKEKVILLLVLLLTVTSWKQIDFNLATLTKQKQQIEREVLRAVPKANYLGKYAYRGQVLMVKAYPTYFFNGSAASLRQDFDVTNHLTQDTISVYAAIYVHDSLKLAATARKNQGSYYSFYPINPPTADSTKGLGSRKMTDYDVILAQAAANHSETAFFFNFSALEYAWHTPPTMMGFFKQNKLHFIDKDAKTYTSFEAIVTARYGGKDQFIQALEQEEAMAKRGRFLLVR